MAATTPRPVSGLPESTMTPAKLAETILPHLEPALSGAWPEIKHVIGPLKATVAWPYWHIMTDARVLVILIRTGIEMGIGLASSWLKPIVEACAELVATFFGDGPVKRYYADLRALLHWSEFSPHVSEALARANANGAIPSPPLPAPNTDSRIGSGWAILPPAGRPPDGQ